MLYMVIERFKGGDPEPVRQRFAEKGRMLPEGLAYISSWIDVTETTCYQLMETQNVKLFDPWIEKWRDIVDFEVVPVISSSEFNGPVAADHAQP